MAQKYGAMFILLPLSDAGLPESLQEKKEIIETILERAFACGLAKEDIIVDGLVTTVEPIPKRLWKRWKPSVTVKKNSWPLSAGCPTSPLGFRNAAM